MLKFCRTKFVGFELESEEFLKIYGTLDDTIYSMQIEMKIKLPELVIDSLTGTMRRITTPFCKEAINLLKNAIGLKIEPGFQSQVRRLVGRPGCRHFGNLINECLESIIPGIVCIKYKQLKENDSKASVQDAFEMVKASYPQIVTFCESFSTF
ncbi:MAG TPA: DUF2889 domain-containing protein [Candidatus Deferrimicrobium sp.]|nr:DUF2889 domain-containing protein [Candidatus Deferrimicrobium sp.]